MAGSSIIQNPEIQKAVVPMRVDFYHADLMVVKGEERSFRTSHPSTAALVVEVSVSTIERDRLKAAIYASAGVQEYWIVDPSRAAVTVFRCPEKDNYANQQEWVGTGLVSSNAIPGFQLDLATFFS